ncbi:MAG: hypothetical protein HKO94_08315 [Flavobacteriaceae bacterium]|nr:hypothetical protein [Flavobacteriaceae bacterium]
MMKYFNLLTIVLFGSAILFSGCKDKTTTTPEKVEPQPIDFSQPPAQQNTATTEPAQNASGVWHYTCSNGCAGGAGSAVNCATCGNKLAHNTAYHGNTNNSQTNDPFNNTPTTANAGQNAAGVWHYSCNNGCAGGAGAAGNCSNCGAELAHNSDYHQ